MGRPSTANGVTARAAHPDRHAAGHRKLRFTTNSRFSRGMSPRKILKYLWREWIRPLALPFLLITAAKSALADINYVPTGSMQRTILCGDVVFINKLAYDLRVPFTFARVARWAEPARSDVVVCFSPED